MDLVGMREDCQDEGDRTNQVLKTCQDNGGLGVCVCVCLWGGGGGGLCSAALLPQARFAAPGTVEQWCYCLKFHSCSLDLSLSLSLSLSLNIHMHTTSWWTGGIPLLSSEHQEICYTREGGARSGGVQGQNLDY